MAPTTLFVIALAFAISMHISHGNNIDCKDLNKDFCAYAVSSTGKRCVLEKRTFGGGYICRSSEIVAEKQLGGWVESEECKAACKVDRKALGISSDSLLDRGFVEGLCSDECYLSCPNIVDLYFNLAAGEGVFLPKLCEARKSSVRREMLILSVGENVVASSPEQAVVLSVDDVSNSEASAPPPT